MVAVLIKGCYCANGIMIAGYEQSFNDKGQMTCKVRRYR